MFEEVNPLRVLERRGSPGMPSMVHGSDIQKLRRREMALDRPKHPSLEFVNRGHEFRITAVPHGDRIELQIADQYGRLLLPFFVEISDAKMRRGRQGRRAIDAIMAQLRTIIESFDDTRFLQLLETPRAASDFDWTSAELQAAARIDWSKPAAILIHEGCSFSIGAFVTEQRMVVLLRDAEGPFDAPMSVPRESMMRLKLKGNDPLDFGVKAMIAQIRTWSAPRTAAFVRDTPRLAERMTPYEQETRRDWLN